MSRIEVSLNPRRYRPRRGAVYINEREAAELLRRINIASERQSDQSVDQTNIVYEEETKEEE